MKKTIYTLLVAMICIFAFSGPVSLPRRYVESGIAPVSVSALYAQDRAEQKDSAAVKSGKNDGVLYRVMGVVLIIWLGLAAYLFTIDRKIVKLERDINER